MKDTILNYLDTATLEEKTIMISLHTDTFRSVVTLNNFLVTTNDKTIEILDANSYYGFAYSEITNAMVEENEDGYDTLYLTYSDGNIFEICGV